MSCIKIVNTIRLTAQRYIELTAEQWREFRSTGEFKARVYPSYSLCVTDKLFLTCKFDPVMVVVNPRVEVVVHKVDDSHADVRFGGYNEVLFSINKFKYTATNEQSNIFFDANRGIAR